MVEDRKLSRLENAVLGLAWKGQPCTAYWVRTQFRASPSSYFSGSAGAVYPALRRLESRGLVAGKEVQRGSRKATHYRVTDSGLKQLRDWLAPPLPSEDVQFAVQPLRTRMHYLEALPEPDRLRFVREALRQSRAYLETVQADYEERSRSDDRFSQLGALGVLFEVRARVGWLQEVERQLAHGTRPDRFPAADAGASDAAS